ncbi:DpnII family type II restriction endonuclease, partial [Acinetobacter baumannii]
LTKNPNILILIPKLLGIRDGKLTKDKKLIVQDIDGTYELDFKNIDKQKIDLYFKFIHDSGLLGAFRNGLNKSFHDYTFGVEAG